MSRNVMLAVGALSWTILIVSVIALYAIGHWISPTITIVLGVAWVTIRVPRLRMIRRQATEAA